jgi:hypothetical protein
MIKPYFVSSDSTEHLTQQSTSCLRAMRKSLISAIFLSCFYGAGLTQTGQAVVCLQHDLASLEDDTS